jgi:transcription antitermination factor NusA-like protein
VWLPKLTGQQEAQSKSSNNNKLQMTKSIKFCFSIPVDSVHIIAGNNGENLKKISEETQTLVTVQSSEDAMSGSNERIITIEGVRECIVNALKVIIPILIDRKNIQPDSLSSSTDSKSVEIVKWLVPQQLCGVLIGKGGEGVKNISKLSGAHVRVLNAHESVEISDERFAFISMIKSLILLILGMFIFEELSHNVNAHYAWFATLPRAARMTPTPRQHFQCWRARSIQHLGTIRARRRPFRR